MKKRNYKTSYGLIVILVLSVLYRFYFQFINPVFNADEISLGNNLKQLSFVELLYPLDYYQSAPPLYLWLQKFVLTIDLFEFWVNIKIVSFAVSIVSLYLFYRFLKKDLGLITIFIFLIFAFNPYITYNTLTLKQYGFDLLGIVLLLNYYDTKKFKTSGWLVFLIWCLISNVGLFATAGYLVFLYFKTFNTINLKSVVRFVKDKALFFIAPLPYVFYFLWYMRQDGAAEMKRYMVAYWQDAFINFDSSFFKFSLRLIHEIWICFYNAYEFWGIFLFLLALPSLILMFGQKPLRYKFEIRLLSFVLCVHLILNVLHLYPLSDRLFLYLSPLFLLLLGASLQYIRPMLGKYSTLVYSSLILVTLVSYATYIGYRNNDVPNLNSYIAKNRIENGLMLTKRVEESLNTFNDFTDDAFNPIENYQILENGAIMTSGLLVTKSHTKLRPNKFSKQSATILDMEAKEKIRLIKKIPGYNIYEILNNGKD